MASCLSPAKEVVERESSTVPNWLELPRDLTQNILQRLGVVEIVMSACLVCPLWWNICKEPIMWRTIGIDTWRMCTIDIRRRNHFSLGFDFVNICMYAIDRSCGRVEDIDIQSFGTKDLLEYIADRASNLIRLRLETFCEFSDELWSKVAEKFPLLEELDITFFVLSRNTLEIFARCCPLLKSLKLSYCEDMDEDEAEAFAVSKMSRLRHLKLSECWLTNDDLFAIVEGCPHLESLDILECLNFDLSECLLKRCHEQIKNFLPPSIKYLGEEDEYDPSDYYPLSLLGQCK